MPKLTEAEELAVALDTAAEEADSGPEPQTSREAATVFYRHSRTLVSAVADDWIIEKIATEISKRRSQRRRAQDRQWSLVGFRPPQKFIRKNGEEQLWSDATLNAFKQGRSVVWKKYKDYKHPAVQKFDKAIAFMENFTHQQQRITWNEAVEKAAL